MLSFEEEMTLYQIAQGVRSVDEMLAQFDQLSKEDQEVAVYNQYFWIWETKATEADIEPAIRASGLNRTDTACRALRKGDLRKGLIHLINLLDNERQKVFRLLICLFITAYQRNLKASMNDPNPENWWYRDLSRAEVVEEIRKTHQELVEKVYHHPSFRSEFVCIAKLRHRREKPSSTQWNPNQPNFISYEEILTKYTSLASKEEQGESILLDSLNRALARAYNLEHGQARKLALEVAELYLKELYY
jgi:hypothetical protein